MGYPVEQTRPRVALKYGGCASRPGGDGGTTAPYNQHESNIGGLGREGLVCSFFNVERKKGEFNVVTRCTEGKKESGNTSNGHHRGMETIRG